MAIYAPFHPTQHAILSDKSPPRALGVNLLESIEFTIFE